MDRLLYGVAYYDEYMPCDRLDKDVEMIKAAGINLVRIAESTWSTCDPQEGVFDFSHVTRVLDAMEAAGISVIIGTPTYAIPTWMVKSHPDVYHFVRPECKFDSVEELKAQIQRDAGSGKRYFEKRGLHY